MHVLLLSDAESGGGAAIAVSRLALGLHEKGVTVSRLVRVANGEGQPWKRFEFPVAADRPLISRLAGKIGIRDDSRAWREKQTNLQLEQQLRQIRPDIIVVNNLHWDQGLGWTPQMVDVCATHSPTVWALYDMWSFTGRCAYSYDCRAFETGCTADCPTPDEYPALPRELISSSWQMRQNLLKKHPQIVAVCASDWLRQEALRGIWSSSRVELIPYGLPINSFQPFEQQKARECIGVKSNEPVLIVAAQSWSTRAKGAVFVSEALKSIRNHRLTVLVMGHGSIDGLPDNITVKALGYLESDRDKSLAYSAADFLLHGAIAEVFGQVFTEAMACGTPGVAFPVGGIPEIIRENETGWLARETTSGALGEAIQRAIDSPHRATFRDRCRAVAVERYSDELCAERYLKLFNEILSQRERSGAV